MCVSEKITLLTRNRPGCERASGNEPGRSGNRKVQQEAAGGGQEAGDAPEFSGSQA